MVRTLIPAVITSTRVKKLPILMIYLPGVKSGPRTRMERRVICIKIYPAMKAAITNDVLIFSVDGHVEKTFVEGLS